MTRRSPAPTLAAAACGALLVVSACRSSPFEGITDAISAELVNADTTLLKGEGFLVSAEVTYTFGLGAPTSMQWGVSDTAKLRLTPLADLTATVSARDTGAALVYAVINGKFRDSVAITVVPQGGIRWRRSLSAAPTLYPAVDDSGRVYVTTETGQLAVFSGTGDPVRTIGLCAGSLGPSVVGNDIVATGQNCTQRVTAAGASAWTLPFGQAAGGVAVAANDAVLVVSSEDTAVVLSRIAPTGDTLWRARLVTALPPAQAPAAIGVEGSVYVPWQATSGADSLARFSSAGLRRWAIPLPGLSRLATPAVVGNRVFVSYAGGLLVADSTGNVLWDRKFADADPAFSTTATASSPIVDRNRNVFLQTADGLISYDSAGAVRWVADSLGGGDETLGVGAPTLLSNNVLVVPCGGDVCAVSSASGGRFWRTQVGGVIAGAAAGPDGTLYVLRRSGNTGELLALWNRQYLNAAGWPTEGAGGQRTRRGP